MNYVKPNALGGGNPPPKGRMELKSIPKRRDNIQMPLILLLPLSLFAGFLEQGPLRGQAFSGLLSTTYALAAVAILFRWVQQDSAARKSKISWMLKITLVILTVFALPYYFVQSRGWFGGAKLLGQAWVIFIAAMLCYRLGCSFA